MKPDERGINYRVLRIPGRAFSFTEVPGGGSMRRGWHSRVLRHEQRTGHGSFAFGEPARYESSRPSLILLGMLPNRTTMTAQLVRWLTKKPENINKSHHFFVTH